jgi:23S rRNA (uracil1939-C5)-methyltransferase
MDAALPSRAIPRCPHFGVCGGCTLQDVPYAAQLAAKADRVRSLLSTAIGALPEPLVHASLEYAYRNRIRLTLRRNGGCLRAGYLGRTSIDAGPYEGMADERAKTADTTAFVPIAQCPIAAPLLWRAAESILAALDAADWLREGSGISPDQLELFTTADQTRLNATLFLRTAARELASEATRALTSLWNHVQQEIPELHGAGVSFLPPASKSRSRRLEVPRPGPSWGSPGLSYPLEITGVGSNSAQTYWVPRGAFFQVNRHLLPELAATELSAALETPTHALAWDLYAGVGLFARPLAASFVRVVAVEASDISSAALAQTKLRNLHAVHATTLDFLQHAVIQRERPDVILLDPPRTGAGPEVCALLARVAAPLIVYVSCAPERLAEDLRLLTAAGYGVSRLDLFDLFPQTSHIETVALLTRT